MFQKTLIAGLLALTLAACGGEQPAPPSDTPPPAASKPAAASPEAAGDDEFSRHLPADAPVVIVGTQAMNPPFEFKDEHGKIIGFDNDILSAAAADQGIRIRALNTKWETIFDELENKKYDLVMGGMGESPERRARFVLSDQYAEAPNVFVVLEDSPIKSMADLKGKKVGFSTNGIGEEELEENKVGAEKVGLLNTYRLAQSLINKEIDGAIVDRLVFDYTLKGFPNAPKYRVLLTTHHGENGVFFAGRKDNAELVKKINIGLANIHKNGIYDKIYRKWFGDNESARKPA